MSGARRRCVNSAHVNCVSLQYQFHCRAAAVTEARHIFTLWWQERRKCSAVGWEVTEQLTISSMTTRLCGTKNHSLPHTLASIRRQPITHNKALTSWPIWQLSRNSCLLVVDHTTGEWRNSEVCVCVREWELSTAVDRQHWCGQCGRDESRGQTLKIHSSEVEEEERVQRKWAFRRQTQKGKQPAISGRQFRPHWLTHPPFRH